jgi:hypothetical protein
MVNQAKTLERLNKEKSYEEKISSDLSTYCLSSLESIPVSEEEKKKIQKSISIIMNDSIRHAHMFEQLIQMVLENGENTY